MEGIPEYTGRYQGEYLKRFPKPPRKENVWTDADLSNGFKMYKQIDHELMSMGFVGVVLMFGGDMMKDRLKKQKNVLIFKRLRHLFAWWYYNVK